tara:strand:- start:475 stop:678 length:204 start_codon:yes stop_codon:yes gene_type:complete
MSEWEWKKSNRLGEGLMAVNKDHSGVHQSDIPSLLDFLAQEGYEFPSGDRDREGHTESEEGFNRFNK